MVKSRNAKYFFTIFCILVIFLIVLSCAPPKYNLTVFVNPVDGGTATPASGTYEEGTEVKLTAQPAPGYRFDYWSGNVTGTSNPVSIIMDNMKTINANFKIQYSINVSTSPDSGGTVIPSEGIYDEGAQIELTAQPAPGYRFDYWGGDAAGNDNPLTLIADGEKRIIAHFKAQFTLVVLKSPDIGGTVTSADGIYDDGSNVQLFAEPAIGYRFVYWSGDATGTSNDISVLMNGNKTITANFIAQYTLTTSVNPETGGNVTPANGTYDSGTVLTLTASVAEGFAFDHWSGDVTGTSESITITIDSDKNIVANFIRILTMGVTNEGRYILVVFPDVITGKYATFHVVGVNYPIIGTDTYDTQGRLIMSMFNFHRVGSNIVEFEWIVNFYSTDSDEIWHHYGRFYNITYNQNGDQIVSFNAIIDGIEYSYP